MAQWAFGTDASRMGDDIEGCRALACDATSAIASFQLPLCEYHIIESYRQALEYIRMQRDRAEMGESITLELPQVVEPVKLPFGICPSCERGGLCRVKSSGEVMCGNHDCGYTANREEFDRLCQERIETASALREVVYYVRFGDRVKIGTTKNLQDRLAFIPHDEVLATEPGGVYVERRRHAQFKHLRARVGRSREWFSLAPELTDHIAAVRAREAAPAS